MVARLLVMVHGRAGSAVDPVFGDAGPLVDEAPLAPLAQRVRGWVAGPEPACGDTARLLGGEPRIEPGLAGPDVGRWSGRTLESVAGEDPEGLRAWLSDPEAAPHGGESVAVAAVRIGRVCDETGWPDGRTAVVVGPVAARLMALHALGGPPELGFRLDLRPGGRIEMSRTDRSWRLLLG